MIGGDLSNVESPKLSMRKSFPLTCDYVGISVLLPVLRLLCVLSGVFVQARVSTDLLVFLGEANILKVRKRLMLVSYCES